MKTFHRKRSLGQDNALAPVCHSVYRERGVCFQAVMPPGVVCIKGVLYPGLGVEQTPPGLGRVMQTSLELGKWAVYICCNAFLF